MAKKTTRTCFVIGPIGAQGSPERAWSDDVFFNLLEPVARENGFEAFRTIDDSRPGDITDQVIKALYDSDLVVADLSGNNPNAMYELAIRHSTGLPFIHLSNDTSSIPFDISVISTIKIESEGFGATQKTISELDKHFKAILRGEAIFDNPVSKYLTLKRVLESGSDEEKELAALRAEVANLARRVSTSEQSSPAKPAPHETTSASSILDRYIKYLAFAEQRTKPSNSDQLSLSGLMSDSSDLVDRAEGDADHEDDT